MHKIKPAIIWAKEYLKNTDEEFVIGIEGAGAEIITEKINSKNIKSSCFYIERVIKSMIWIYGGYRIYLSGDSRIIEYIKDVYSHSGSRKFDVEFMEEIYQRPFEIKEGKIKALKLSRKISMGEGEGKRIGLDLGGTSIKYSVVEDGNDIFSGVLKWNPTQMNNSLYHTQMLKKAYGICEEKIGKAQSLGISTAGIIADNKVRVSSLFRNTYDKDYSGFYQLNENYIIINDGDAAVLGSMQEGGKTGVLGIAIGTSEAGGYVDETGSVTGYLNELAFVPIDFSDESYIDSWSGDRGCGVSFLSQDGLINMCERSGIIFPDDMETSKKCIYAEELWQNGDERAQAAFRMMGEMLGYALMWYQKFYKINECVVFGGVISGKAGDYAVECASELFKNVHKGENSRFAQSIAAAKLTKM